MAMRVLHILLLNLLMNKYRKRDLLRADLFVFLESIHQGMKYVTALC